MLSVESFWMGHSRRTILSVAGVLVCALVYRVLYAWHNKRRRIRALGGQATVVETKLPLGLDYINKATSYSRSGRNLLLWHETMQLAKHEASPTVEVSIGGTRTILTADPRNVKAVLSTQFPDFGKGPQFNADWHDFLGDSVFSTDEQAWKDARAIVRSQFIKERLSDVDLMSRHMAELLEMLVLDGDTMDATTVIYGFTLDVATDFLMGTTVDALHDPDNPFAKAFAAIQRIQMTMTKMGALARFYPRRELRKHLDTFNSFVQPFVDQALALSPKASENTTKAEYTFLHAIASYSRDPKFLRDQIAAVMLAGRDTTASTLIWLLYELAFAPHVVFALREEISQHLAPGQLPTFTHLKAMRLLQHTINETLRIYPAIPLNVRVALQDTTLPCGGGLSGEGAVAVLAGTPVVYSTHFMHLSAAIYPSEASFPDPALFEPSRWERWRPQNHSYIPFNAGPRLCAGQQFALQEISFVVVRLLQRYSRLEPVADLSKRNPRQVPPRYGGKSLAQRVWESRVKMKSNVVLQPAEPITVRFIR